MNKQCATSSKIALAALFGAIALVGCGGSDNDEPTPTPAPAPAPAPTPAPAPPAGSAFATLLNASDTAENGKIETYAFAEKSNEQTPGAVTFASGSVTFSTALSGNQAFSGAALRFYAPNNTGAAPVTTFNASTHTKLRIQLKSTTDALLTIKLQPSPLAADGCTATAQTVVSATLTELVIDLNTASFQLPDYCGGAGSSVATVKPALYAVDVINAATTTGSHDVTVGAISLSAD